MLDEQAGAAAAVAAEEEPNSGRLEYQLPAHQLTKGALSATVMLHCVGLAIPRLLDFPVHPHHPVQFLWLTGAEWKCSLTSECESEDWSTFTQTIKGGEAHLVLRGIDDRRWMTGARQSVVFII
jgi:hypothetical protein